MSKAAAKVDRAADLTAIVGIATTAPQAVMGGRLSMRAKWTATLTGTFSLECSFGDGEWDPVPGASAEFTANGNAQPAGGAGGSQVWNFVGPPGGLWRLKYVGTVGTGAIAIRYAWVVEA